jgi:hypothetical protein
MSENGSNIGVLDIDAWSREFGEMQQLLQKSRADLIKMEGEVLALYERSEKDTLAAQALSVISASFAEKFGSEDEIAARTAALEVRAREMNLQLAQEKSRNEQAGKDSIARSKKRKSNLINRGFI